MFLLYKKMYFHNTYTTRTVVKTLANDSILLYGSFRQFELKTVSITWDFIGRILDMYFPRHTEDNWIL